MATALDILESTWEEVKGSSFLIKPLDGRDMLKVSDLVTFDEAGRTLLNGNACEMLIKLGLQGWKNFHDKEGNEALFTANQDKNIARLPFEVIRPLATAILAKSTIEVEDEKN